ncbi:response regulator [Paraburkholderia tropica]|uniref:response regulator n=1 Tax=Paraburkholderia tropica TaxID=92647 RepID=UPI0022B243C4|nr:response regulator [Paraburkholderia tropica]
MSPLSAARATFALNVGEWVRRFRFVIFWFLVAGHYGRLTPQLFHSTYCPNSRSHLSAWSYLKQTDVDIVISDLRMPGMSGGVLCEKIRDDVTLASIPVILVSGEYSPPAFVRYDCYLRKPLNTEHLSAVARRLLVLDPHRATGAMQSRASNLKADTDE